LAAVKIFQSYLKAPFLILLILETGVVFTSVYAASYLRFYTNNSEFLLLLDGLWLKAIVIATITPVSMLATGLYQGQIREGFAGVLLRLIVSFLASGILITLIFYLFPGLFLGRGIIAIAYFLSFIVIGTVRSIFIELVDSSTFKKRILVYGAGDTASHIDDKLRRQSDRRGFEIVGYVLLSQQTCEVDEARLVNVNSTLLQFSRDSNIDEIVVATSDIDRNIPVDDLVNCKLRGIEVVDILSFFEREAGQIRIDILDPSWLVTSDGFRQSIIQNHIKRIFDICVSLIILAVSAPFLLLAIIAIWIEDGPKASLIYSQIRVGKQGKHYKIYKFRSMRQDAEKSGEAVWASKTDSRVTRVGSFIRKTRLDELPQILNVLNGSMSFVGPRPERPQFIEQLAKQIPYYNERHLVKPGITGWAQLLYPYGSSVIDSYQKQLFDMYYVKNHTLFLDCLILLQTVEVVMFGKGAR
jgi:sugar transferase (PEP-CTERM system associated)